MYYCNLFILLAMFRILEINLDQYIHVKNVYLINKSQINKLQMCTHKTLPRISSFLIGY